MVTTGTPGQDNISLPIVNFNSSPSSVHNSVIFSGSSVSAVSKLSKDGSSDKPVHLISRFKKKSTPELVLVKRRIGTLFIFI